MKILRIIYLLNVIFYLQVNKQYSATDLEAFMKLAANWQNTNHNLLEGVDIKGGKFKQKEIFKLFFN